MPCAPDQGGRMFDYLAAGGGAVSVSGGNLTLVVVVAVIALLALAVAGWLVREVLAASQGTEKMQEIARAIQEGAGAYLGASSGPSACSWSSSSSSCCCCPPNRRASGGAGLP